MSDCPTKPTANRLPPDELRAAVAALMLDQQCQTCRWFEPPASRPGLHRCFVQDEPFIATYRHEGCNRHEHI